MADWTQCKKDLTWSWNNEEDNHQDAIDDYRAGDKDDAFDTLWDIQGHNPSGQRNYKKCRKDDPGWFWSMVVKVADAD